MLRSLQSVVFHGEITSITDNKPLAKGDRLRNLNSFIDNRGLLRVGGRLSEASIPYTEKHSIILPHDHLSC